MLENITCQVLGDGRLRCDGEIYQEEEKQLSWGDTQFFVYLAVYVALVLTAGLMSGLTMGLLSLDMMTLKTLKDGGTPQEKKHASKIIPIIKRHHLLLVTLLLGNAAAVEAMPIFLDKISDPVTAIVVSVTAVLIVGEVIPQAICTRFGLAIGATLAPVVYGLMFLFFVVSWPLSKLLDCLLGKDHATFYRRAQLKVLVDLHGTPNQDLLAANAEHLSPDEVMIIKGALDMKGKTVKDAMLPLDCVYMLSINSFLDDRTMTELLQQTHSRIPVYVDSRENIISILLVKTLIKLDPEDATPVTDLIKNDVGKPVLFTTEDKPLYDQLNEFQTGRGHLAVVQRQEKRTVSMSSQSSVLEGTDTAPLLGNDSEDDDDLLIDVKPKTVGIITLEDILEELIQEEIIDETDVYIDIKKHIQVARAKAARHCHDEVAQSKVQRSQSHPPVSRPNRTEVSVNVQLENDHTDRVHEDTSHLLNTQVLA